MKVIASAVAALFVDANVKSKVIDLFNEVSQVSSSGGMTIGIGSGRPIVVCMGKPSLADEKSLRVELRKLDEKIKLSRTNDVDIRCGQYDIAPDAATWKKLAKAEKSEKTDKPTTPVITDTPAVVETPAVQDVQQPA